MFLNIHGENYEIDQDNAIYFTGDTLIEGLYVDVSEDDYLFIPSEAVEEEVLPDLLDSLTQERIHVVDLVYYDPEEPPFCFIINALCRYFAREIDCTLGDEDD